jgi:hypothetical protein
VGGCTARWSRLLGAVLIGVLALGLFAVWQRRLRPPLTGDEPGYLVVAESLRFDHDINLANNFGVHARISSALAQPATPARSVRIESPTDWRPTQPIGLGALLTPAVAIGHRGAAELLWARRLMMLLAALLVWQIFELAADCVSVGLAAAIAGGVALAFPLVGYSNQLYPEIPAALLFTIGLRGVLTSERPAPISVGLAAAGLPWLSLRFLPLAVALVVGLIARGGTRSESRRFRPSVIAGGVLAISCVALVVFDPVSVFHGSHPIVPSPINTYRTGIGGMFSPVFGLLPFAPQLSLGVVGLGLVARLRGHAGAAAVIGALVYELVAIPFGFRGYALPARFQVVLIPLLALGIVQLARAYPRLLALFAAATVLGVIVLVQAGSQPTYGYLYNDPQRPTLPALKPVARILPEFSLAPGHTGVVIPGRRLDDAPMVALRRGTYFATLRAAPQSSSGARVIIDLVTGRTTRRVVDVTYMLSPRGTVTVPFKVHRSGDEYRFRIEAPDVAHERADVESVAVRLTGHAESRTAPSRRDLPLGLLWTFLVLALAVVANRLSTTNR